MNAHGKIEIETTVNMTSKGQVLIPKEIRDRMGLKPNAPVRVCINRNGETVILAHRRRRQCEGRRAHSGAGEHRAAGDVRNELGHGQGLP